MAHLQKRSGVPAVTEVFASRIAARLEALATANAAIHLRDCFNLNLATNATNPRAAALAMLDWPDPETMATGVANLRKGLDKMYYIRP